MDPSETFQIYQRLGLALAIGLLIGIERGWQEREGPAGSRTAGVRTHALVGLLGGVAAALSLEFGAIVLAASALAFALPYAAYYWREQVAKEDFSITSVIAGFLAFGLGAYAVVGEMEAAAAAGVATTALLASRHALHAFLRRITWAELRSTIVLLAMAVILLPILPEEPIDPWGALVPREVWLFTVLIATVSYAGYVAVRLFGGTKGTLVAAAAGGLVSSTAATVTFSRLAKQAGTMKRAAAAGIAIAWAMSVGRAYLLAVIVAPALAWVLLPGIAGLALVLTVAAVLLVFRAKSGEVGPDLGLRNPFELGEVLRFGALIAGVLFLATVASKEFGNAGLLTLALLSGLADVDAITLSVAKQAGRALEPIGAARAILLAAASNTFAKAVIALVVGGARFGWSLAAIAILSIAAGAGGLLVSELLLAE